MRKENRENDDNDDGNDLGLDLRRLLGYGGGGLLTAAGGFLSCWHTFDMLDRLGYDLQSRDPDIQQDLPPWILAFFAAPLYAVLAGVAGWYLWPYTTALFVASKYFCCCCGGAGAGGALSTTGTVVHYHKVLETRATENGVGYFAAHVYTIYYRLVDDNERRRQRKQRQEQPEEVDYYHSVEATTTTAAAIGSADSAATTTTNFYFYGAVEYKTIHFLTHDAADATALLYQPALGGGFPQFRIQDRVVLWVYPARPRSVAVVATGGKNHNNIYNNNYKNDDDDDVVAGYIVTAVWCVAATPVVAAVAYFGGWIGTALTTVGTFLVAWTAWALAQNASSITAEEYHAHVVGHVPTGASNNDASGLSTPAADAAAATLS